MFAFVNKLLNLLTKNDRCEMIDDSNSLWNKFEIKNMDLMNGDRAMHYSRFKQIMVMN